MKPQLHKMVGFHGRGGVMVTAPASADSPYDFVSRYFCPKSGLSEVFYLLKVKSVTLAECHITYLFGKYRSMIKLCSKS